jgi:hypothetical protein
MEKDLLDILNDFRIVLGSTCLERTAGLKDAMGENCQYYRRSKDIFISKEYDLVKNRFLQCLEEFRKVEGQSFGR